MKIDLIAVGRKMPSWVNDVVGDYRKRLPPHFKLNVIEVPLANRSGAAASVEKIKALEGEALLEKVGREHYVVALDEGGRTLTTQQLAQRVDTIRESGKNLALLAGGPDGLSGECLDRADEIWSLSALTLPHTTVRIVVAEQVYRVWSILNGHPYHRQ